ncbi:hypothetical protein GH5_07123 [Leishmania sp. Ghana 2012 LV757]|uniref:hypothetical protein n=1 Tax=Leishmania sp. Ghana 2012 LV757 TaxID=2803181 RepID=UPI001B5DCE84|nr:hypothetical protein GH5_07123 [Leishmania sp. Ghana 2012 LV757]
MEEWATRTVPGFSSFMEDVKEVGLTASNALAAEYAAHAFASVQQQCNEYFKAWGRRQDTMQALLAELRLEYATLRGGAQGSSGGSPSSTTPGSACDPEAAKRIDEYQTQLLVLHRQMAEVDVGVAEWVNTCTAHFPELTPTLRQLPSTCVESVVERDERTAMTRAVRPRRRWHGTTGHLALSPSSVSAPFSTTHASRLSR